MTRSGQAVEHESVLFLVEASTTSKRQRRYFLFFKVEWKNWMESGTIQAAL